MTRALTVLVRRFAHALSDLAPMILVIAFFQIVVFAAAVPESRELVRRAALRDLGSHALIQGLESGLFPLGEAIAQGFARKGSATALFGFRILPGIRHHGRRAGTDSGGGGGGGGRL